MKKTKWIMTRGLSASVFVFLISQSAFCVSQINSEFEIVLPRQFQQKLIDKKWETLMNKEFSGNWQFPDQEILSSNVPVKVKQVSLQMRSYLEKPALVENQSLIELNSKNLQAELLLGEVSVDHVIEKDIGGVTGRFRVQAVCKNVVLSLQPDKGQFSMVVSPVIEGTHAGGEVQSVSVSWLPGSWVSKSMECSGAQGFADIIKAELSTLTNDSRRLIEPQKELIKKNVQDYLGSFQLDFSTEKEVLVARPDIKVQMKINDTQDLGGAGMRLRGIFEIKFLKDQAKDIRYLKMKGVNSQGDAKQVLLYLPEDFLKEVAMHSYAANTWLHQVMSDKISGFTSLMNSRFSQFFVWPALMSFSKSAKFRFDLYSNKNVDVKGSGDVYQLQSTMLSRMMAPKSGGLVPFMYFNVPLTSKVRVSLQDSKVLATFSHVNLSLNPQWDASYVRNYGPSRSFSTSTIQGRLSDSLEGKTVSASLPQIPVGLGMNMRVMKMQAVQGKNLVFLLSP